MMLDIKDYKGLVDSFHRQLLDVKEESTNVRLSEDKWSLREIIGHLIDSASNNHQRFVRLQFDDLLDFPIYNPEKWISVQKYIDVKWYVLVTLWYNYNLLLLDIIEKVDEKAYGNVWAKGEEAIPLNELIESYYKHMAYHVEHFKNRVKEL